MQNEWMMITVYLGMAVYAIVQYINVGWPELSISPAPVLPFVHSFSLYTGQRIQSQVIHPKKYTNGDSLETIASLSINKIFLDGKLKRAF